MTHSPLLIYNLFPRLAGRIEDWNRWVDHISGMGFTWIYVNPFHLTGGSGSLYAVRDYFDFSPLFVPISHPGARRQHGARALRDVLEHAHARGLQVAMDLVINHTATDSPLIQRHPGWFKWNKQRRIVHPGCPDGKHRVVWGDLAQLDFRTRPALRELLAYLSEVVATYLQLGFDGFRCDAAYKIPSHAWKVLIRNARKIKKDVVFMGETLGCTHKQVLRIQRAGFHAVFNSFRWWDLHHPGGFHGHNQIASKVRSIAFPESHDTPRLAAELGCDRGRILQRYALASFVSSGVMLPQGYEFGATQRMQVVGHRLQSLEPPQFQIERDIAYLNGLKRQVPLLQRDGILRRIELGEGLCGFTREHRGQRLVVLAHLWGGPRHVSLDASVLGAQVRILYGLRTLEAGALRTQLVPGEVFASLGHV